MSIGKCGIGGVGISDCTVFACSTLCGITGESCHESFDGLSHTTRGADGELGDDVGPVLLDVPGFEPCLLKIDLSCDGSNHVRDEGLALLDGSILG